MAEKKSENLERAILVGMKRAGTRFSVEESLEELERLAATAGAIVVGKVIKHTERPDPKFLIGSGKVEEVRCLIEKTRADLVIVDEELNPTQLRNLEKELQGRVIDRTQLILDIFAKAARTKEGKLQVELAQCEYLLPRLVGFGEFMSRTGGGIGTRGPGETKLETDRRRIKKHISAIREELERVRMMRKLHREARKSIPFPLVSLVGYTNAGKSTLLNYLTGAGVLAEDKLFSTLDPTTRRLVLPSRTVILLTDTVGFIDKLPVRLVSAFRATLEELQEADLILHVVDYSSPCHREQEEAVMETLEELGCHEKPRIVILNKIDRLTYRPTMKDVDDGRIMISALTGENVENLLLEIDRALSGIRKRIRLRIPWSEGAVISFVKGNGKILYEQNREEGCELLVELERRFLPRVGAFIVETLSEKSSQSSADIFSSSSFENV